MDMLNYPIMQLKLLVCGIIRIIVGESSSSGTGLPQPPVCFALIDDSLLLIVNQVTKILWQLPYSSYFCFEIRVNWKRNTNYFVILLCIAVSVGEKESRARYLLTEICKEVRKSCLYIGTININKK